MYCIVRILMKHPSTQGLILTLALRHYDEIKRSCFPPENVSFAPTLKAADTLLTLVVERGAFHPSIHYLKQPGIGVVDLYICLPSVVDNWCVWRAPSREREREGRLIIFWAY